MELFIICYFSSFSLGIIKFNIIPTIEAKLIPEIVTDKSPITIDTIAPPKPRTNIEEATITFFGISKSILFLIKQ